MKLSFDKGSLPSKDIGDYIKKYGGLQDTVEPYVYLPDLEENGYEYYDLESDDMHTVKVSQPTGINKNDHKYLPNTVFVYVNNNATNAIATEINNTPVIGIYIGSIADIEYCANLIIGTSYEQENFPLSKFKPKKIYIDSDGNLTVTSEDSLLGYKDERILSYMVSEAALRFLVLHEIGRHVKGHISELRKHENFVLLKATDKVNSDFEIEADTYAATKIAEEFDLILLGLSKHKADFEESSLEELEFLALNIMVTALTLPFSILYQPEIGAIKDSFKSTIAYREIYAIIILAVELYKNEACRRAVTFGLLNQNFDEAQQLSREIDIEQIKVKRTIDFNDFFVYIRELFIESKRLYYQVNQIPNIDIYLDHYCNVLEYFKNESR